MIIPFAGSPVGKEARDLLAFVELFEGSDRAAWNNDYLQMTPEARERFAAMVDALSQRRNDCENAAAVFGVD